jgi:hypothetical protein
LAHAYTPGLKVLEYTVLTKERRLPLPGEIVAEKGSRVSAEQVVARTKLPGNVQTLNVAGLLGILPAEIDDVMLKKIGEKCEKEAVIAESKGFFGLFKSQVKSPITGEIESVSKITGEVVDIIKNEGVAIRTAGSYIQGIFGIGGETIGQIAMAVDDPKEVLTPSQIDKSFKDKVIIGGAMAEYSALEKARDVGAKGVVVGGIEDQDLKRFMGYDIGVAITGSEDVGITLIATEGFGKLRMADRTFELLKSLSGKKTSMNGATQIRAGVMRPELIVPADTKAPKEKKADLSTGTGLETGMKVRIIREPYFGLIGKVVGLPVELAQVETEAKVRVLDVELEDNKKVTLPRANVEIIEE